MPITKNTPIETVIKDFVSSTDKRFEGKTKADRIAMAKGAYYSMQEESTTTKETTMSVETLIEQITEGRESDEITTTVNEILNKKIVERVEGLKESVMKKILAGVDTGK